MCYNKRMKYLRVSVETTTEFSDIVANTLFDCGTAGVSVKDHNDVLESLKSPLNWDYFDESVLAGDQRVIITGFFDESVPVEAVISAVSRLKGDPYFETGSLEVTSGVEDTAAWENVWKQYYKPVPCGRITIVPKWFTFESKESVPVYIDPGLAFGTGNHETTAMCAELLAEHGAEGLTVADVGCGSGILGVCALKLGAKSCLFIDIDENAVKAAEENAALNGVGHAARFILGDLSQAAKESADLVLANLTADLLIRLKTEAGALIKSGGTLIISGVLDTYAERVLSAYADGFRLVESRKRNCWHAYRYCKE